MLDCSWPTKACCQWSDRPYTNSDVFKIDEILLEGVMTSRYLILILILLNWRCKCICLTPTRYSRPGWRSSGQPSRSIKATTLKLSKTKPTRRKSSKSIRSKVRPTAATRTPSNEWRTILKWPRRSLKAGRLMSVECLKWRWGSTWLRRCNRRQSTNWSNKRATWIHTNNF